MDEPLSNLDAKLRVQMRGEIGRLQQELGVTTIFVTHDQVEALTMGSHVAVMRHGVLQQHGRPQDVYDHPANLFVATFIGSPAMNLVRAELAGGPDNYSVAFGGQDIRVPASATASRPGLRRYVGREVAFAVRPEHLGEATGDGAAEARIRGRVRFVESLGSDKFVEITIDAMPVVSEGVLEVVADIDAAALSALRHEERAQQTVVVARMNAHSPVEPGELVAVEVDTAHVHFFDLESGAAIEG
jgi:multiple sugar transport system ATP-binding protein